MPPSEKRNRLTHRAEVFALGASAQVASVALALGGVVYALGLIKSSWVPAVVATAGAAVGFGLGFLLLEAARRARPPRVFISHSFANRGLAHELASQLRSVGIFVGLPEDEIRLGDTIKTRVLEVIPRYRNVVVLLTPEFNKSRWSRTELEIARRANARIIPIIYGNTEVPSELESTMYLRTQAIGPEVAKAVEMAITSGRGVSPERQRSVETNSGPPADPGPLRN